MGETTSDDRLHPKTFVFGVELNEEHAAFPLSVLRQEPVLNYENGPAQFLVIYNGKSSAAYAFDRQVDGQLLTFERVENGFPFITDLETGTLWNGRTGEAVEGVLAGSRLTRIKGTLSFWFAWKDFYPETHIYELEN